VQDGAGAWSTFTGTMAANGTFSIGGVPNGAYWLKFQEATATATVGAATYLDAAAGNGIDLGFDQLGRSTVTRPTAAQTTQVTFPVTLVRTWPTNGTDQIQIASSNADVGEWLSRVAPDFRSNFAASNGDRLPLNLIWTGDVVTLFHLYGATDGTSNLGYRAARAMGSRTDTNIQTAGSAVTANRYTVTQPGTTVAFPGGLWSTATFESFRTLMNLPTGTGNTHTLVIGASVGTLTGNGPVPRNAPPTLFVMTAPAGTANVTVGSSLQYAHVLARTGSVTAVWTEWRGVEYGGSVTFTAPGATGGITERASMGRREPLTSVSALTPPLSPARTLAITPAGGVATAAYGAVTGVGVNPVLSWDVPTVGTPTSYTVEVFRLTRNGTATTSAKVATIYTGATRVPFPPGVLLAGSAHYVRVTARAIASDPWALAPLRRVVVGSWAQTLSGTITP
jgi:hypothetical protein